MDRSNFYNVIHLSFSFLLIFMSYYVAQTFQTSSTHAKDGALAVGIIYLVFCLANLILSSYITRLIGVRLTLIFSSLTYVLFIAANIKHNTWLLYISAFFLGLGAALLWTAQGVYVAVSVNQYEQVNNLVSSSKQGFINGIFFGIVQMSLTIGNLLTSLLFRLNYQEWIIFTVMTGIVGTGAISLIFLRPIKIPKNTKQPSILANLSMLLEIPFLLLIPTMCFSGLAPGFTFSAIPPLIIDRSRKFLMFALYGIVSSCSSFVFGKLSEHLCRRLHIFVIGALTYIIIFGLLLMLWKPPLDENRIEIFVIIIICLSIGDTIFATQIISVIAIFYGETRPTEAFAYFRAFQAGCTGLGFVAQVYVSFSVQILCLIIILLLTIITLIYEDYGIISLDTGKKIISLQKQDKNKMETEVEVQIPLATSPDTA